MAKTTTILAVVLALAIGGGAFFVGFLMSNNWMINTDPAELTPTIDGIIEKREWLRSSYYNIPFYLDVDNEVDPVVDLANVDGWNYLSVAEDEDYYYIAADLCSDRTNNKAGEWFALHLANQLPDTFMSELAFYALEDFGYEYFFYDVEAETPFPHFLNPSGGTLTAYDIPITPQTDLMELYRGTLDGGFDEIWTEYDESNITLTSKYYEEVPAVWLEGQFFALHFGVNITEKFPDQEIGTFMSSLSDMDLEYRLVSNLTSNPAGHFGLPQEYFGAVAEHGGEPGNMTVLGFLNDYNELYYTADIVSSGTVDLNHNSINATNGMFYFSIYGWNDEDGVDSTNFELKIDKLSLRFVVDDFASIEGNTIGTGNYEIAYGYGPSDNCAEDHRMFEFKIAKSEFPVLDDEMLYLNLAGYGTMLIAGTNYWMYPHYGFPIPPVFLSIYDKNQFMTFDMSIT